MNLGSGFKGKLRKCLDSFLDLGSGSKINLRKYLDPFEALEPDPREIYESIRILFCDLGSRSKEKWYKKLKYCKSCIGILGLDLGTGNLTFDIKQIRKKNMTIYKEWIQ